MTNTAKLALARRMAGVTQNEAAVLAKCSPPLARKFERGGPMAIKDPLKRARLVRVYDDFAAASLAAA